MSKVCLNGLLFLFLAGGSLNCFGQARMVFSNDAYLVIDNAAQLVVDNPNANAISVNASGGNIVSEDENDLIKWNIGNNSGAYVIPWTNANNVKIPLEVFVTSAGVGGGHFLFSTHTDNDAVNNWNNFDYRPSDVTNMGGSGIPNNSANVIDRFWRIEHTGYTTAPQAMMNFGYDDAERTNPGNTIPAGSMFAQEFDAGQGFQGAWYIPGSGTDTYPVTVVVGADAVANPFFKSWTLSVITVPLPAENLVFEAVREGMKVRLDWEMEETNLMEYFVVEKSDDGLVFSDMKREPALPGTLKYAVWDQEPFPGLNHYRLRTIDLNGEVQHSEVRSVLMEEQSIKVFPNPLAGNQVQIHLTGMEGEHLQIQMVDLAGRILMTHQLVVQGVQEIVGFDLAESLAAGVYMVEVRSETGGLYRQKVIVR